MLKSGDQVMKRLLATTACLCLATSPLMAETFRTDVWADNWFEMRINGTKVAEDSVPITTERSFNAESFSFDADRPFTIGLVVKDFKQDGTGLEYIGTRRQQMGDGGVIVQVRDSAGNSIAVSNSNWSCMVIHTAPLDKSCARERNPVPGKGPPARLTPNPNPPDGIRQALTRQAGPRRLNIPNAPFGPRMAMIGYAGIAMHA